MVTFGCQAFQVLHVIHLDRLCVVMGCLEMDVGKYHEIAFDMAVQRDFK